MKRKLTKQVKVGNVKIGGGAIVSVQSMTKSKNLLEIIKEIKELESLGCELIRVAIPDFESVKKIKKIKKETHIPLIADIHFNYKLAIESIKQGADKVRMNPGNIGSKEKVREVVKYAKDYNIPIRIGVNSGSLEKDILSKYGSSTSDALFESIKKWVKIIEDFGFDSLVLSAKSSDTNTTIETYRKISRELNYPLHIGVTATGSGIQGMVRSSIGIGTLLSEGIGDTLRVSLTGSSRDEVKLGHEILKSLGFKKKEPQIIACPTCGRCEINVEKLANEVEKGLNSVGAYCNTPLRIAVMGCIVNGPGEARDADFGVTGGKGKGIIFRKGKIIKKVAENKIVATLLEEIKNT
ncbi:flavodoxin-dependent (E)-4-hydroxy-3-methylbut-2-enyl-diphosphate synthase [candidate division WOR-3 bacterium]|nr:flavodoxin-dependent (E)-4-hydroxy-3-methylbut-2-enyl-diphosphate synthase [candidate division WOR-3 bacterium]